MQHDMGNRAVHTEMQAVDPAMIQMMHDNEWAAGLQPREHYAWECLCLLLLAAVSPRLTAAISPGSGGFLR